MPHDVLERPWAKVGMDLFHVDGADYVIVVDYNSNFFEVDKLKNALSSSVIHKVKGYFARHGIPETVISDNGPQFDSSQFKSFAKEWGFEQKTSSPRYPQSNGKVENSVKRCKSIIKKCLTAKADINLELLDFRNKPTEKIGSLPAQRLFGRRTKTRLPTSSQKLAPQAPSPQQVGSRVASAKEIQVETYDKKSKDLPPLNPGEKAHEETGRQRVVVGRMHEAGWKAFVSGEAGSKYRRNRRELRATKEDGTFAEEPELEIRQGEAEAKAGPTSARSIPEEPEESTSQPTEDSERVRNEVQETRVTKSGRVSRKPKYLEDYVTK